jgi:hypothetical protein
VNGVPGNGEQRCGSDSDIMIACESLREHARMFNKSPALAIRVGQDEMANTPAREGTGRRESATARLDRFRAEEPNPRLLLLCKRHGAGGNRDFSLWRNFWGVLNPLLNGNRIAITLAVCVWR